MLTQEKLKQLLQYYPESGVFIRLDALMVDKKLVGKRAGNIKNNGYREIAVRGKAYLEHRLAFLYMTGEWPKEDVDHINNIRDDNRWNNLREANRSLNMQNVKKPSKNNKHGYWGCTKHGSKYRATIVVNGKQIRLGNFEEPKDAEAAYIEAKKKYHKGYNHG